MTDRVRHHILHEESVNPFDSSPRTEAEAVHDFKVTAALVAMTQALNNTRRSVRMQDLAEMKFLHAVFEGELPEVDGIRHGVFLYSVSGVHNGNRVDRVLLDGHCIQVSAENRREAEKLAQAGLNDTITAANVFAMTGGEGLVEHNQGIETDAGGRRAH